MSAPAQQPLRPPAILLGLVGGGIQRSRTPALHEAEGEAQGLRIVYRLFDTQNWPDGNAPALPEILDAAETAGFAGLNITYPYKIDVIEHLHDLSDDAEAVGAVNTVVFSDGRRVGHNTDRFGFSESFRRNLAGEPRERVLLIGAGGAGAAAANALLENGVRHVEICDTDSARAERLAAGVARRHGMGRASVETDIDKAGATIDGVVNATPVGMEHLPGSPFPLDRVKLPLWVMDVIYIPLETELVRTARDNGCRAVGGGDMAVFQAARAFEHFTGRRADPSRMLAAFELRGGSAAPDAA